MSKNWQFLAIALVAGVLGYALGRGGAMPKAHAQGDGAAGRVICVIGAERNGYAPVILVDTREESISAYEWNYAGRSLELESARTYRFDKLLYDYDTDGPSIFQVRDRVNAQPPLR